MATMTTPVFFDSHGNAWSPCDCEHSDAEAFGPAGCSRQRADVLPLAGWGDGDTWEDPEGWVWLELDDELDATHPRRKTTTRLDTRAGD